MNQSQALQQAERIEARLKKLGMRFRPHYTLGPKLSLQNIWKQQSRQDSHNRNAQTA